MVVTLAVLLLGSSVAPAGALPLVAALERPETSLVSLLLTDDMIYSIEQKDGGPAEVVARPLAADAVAWSRQVPADGSDSPPYLQRFDPHLAVTSGGGVTVLLDARSGQVVWESGESVRTQLTENRIVLWEQGRLGLFDPFTVRVQWWRPSPIPVVDAVSTDEHVLVTDENGDTVAYVRSTGEVAGSVRDAAGEQGSESRLNVTVGDGRAYRLTESAVTALSLPDLRVVWSTPISGPFDIAWCGAHLCVTGTTGVTALHRDSGTVAWSGSEWVSLQEGLATRKNGRTVMLDPDTGRVRSELGRALPAGDWILQTSRDGVSVFDRRTWQLRGTLPGVDPLWCTQEARHLACQTNEGGVTVWRLP